MLAVGGGGVSDVLDVPVHDDIAYIDSAAINVNVAVNVDCAAPLLREDLLAVGSVRVGDVLCVAECHAATGYVHAVNDHIGAPKERAQEAVDVTRELSLRERACAQRTRTVSIQG